MSHQGRSPRTPETAGTEAGRFSSEGDHERKPEPAGLRAGRLGSEGNRERKPEAAGLRAGRLSSEGDRERKPEAAGLRAGRTADAPESRRIHELTLHNPQGATEILVGPGALDAAAERFTPWLSGRTVFTLSSPLVLEHQGERLTPLTQAAAHTVPLEAPDGEAAKRLSVAESLWEQMLAAGGKRDSRLITFGGGTIGDLGGFLAGCFTRGIDYVQVPTTLLAQADAAIGGKTGVDLAAGKNAVGLFHHPHMVVADPAVFATLPLREWRCGAVEILKIGLADDDALFTRVEEAWDGLMRGDLAAAAAVLPGAIAAKVRIVEADPAEGDRRRILNLGHTLAHALEAAGDYRRLRHGEAVAYGLLFALRLAARRGLDADTSRRVRDLLGALELPPLPDVPADRLVELMRGDKKARESGLTWVLPRAVGAVDVAVPLPEAEIREELEAFLAEQPHGTPSRRTSKPTGA